MLMLLLFSGRGLSDRNLISRLRLFKVLRVAKFESDPKNLKILDLKSWIKI